MKTETAYSTVPPSYEGTTGQYAPPMQAAPAAPAMSAAQVGEQYRAELFARCAKGIHEPQRKYGVCGIITAIACFPLGLICLFADSNKVCARCGVRLEA
ncbi:hypothetical protein L208DRAFT_1395418 [Tricholoma matsutake]|nr:hypothetical protein L208DRAFT_1395418 [Tricholoma matsutake 945]